ncbi:MAG: glycosyltransferase family 39 protein [Gaiellaceae bacterium]
MRGWVGRLRKLPAGYALVLLVLGAALLRALAGLRVSGPFIAPDEMTYAELGRSLWSSGRLEVLGHHVDLYSVVYPALAGLPLSLGGIKSSFTALAVVQPFVMSLVALPVYLWARRLVAPRPALLAAALALALPELAYSSLIMTEVVFYPVMALAAWRMAVAIAQPSRRNDGLALAAILLALLTRIQALALVPALVLALLVVALLERSPAAFRRSLRLLAGIAGLGVAWLAWRIVSGGEVLGVYAGATRGYRIGHAARYVGYHFADLLILTGVVPACALVLLTVTAARRFERELAALVGVAVGLSLALVVEVGVFASSNVHHLAERNLLGAAPPLLVVAGVWIGQGCSRPRLAATLVGLAAAAALLLLPIGPLTAPDALHDGLTLVPIARLGHALGSVSAVYSTLVAVLVLGFVLLPRRLLALLPVLLLALLAAGSVEASRYVAQRADAARQGFPGGAIGWVDAATREPVAYLYDGEPWDAVWQQVFWNRRIERVFDLGPATIPGPVPQQRLRALADGRLVDSTGKSPDSSEVVAATPLTLAGEPLASIPESEVAQSGLTLWRPERPLRLSWTKNGVLPNGDIPTLAHFDVYACRGGTLILTLLGKQDARVEIDLSGKPVRTFRLTSGEIWRGRIATPSSPDGVCRYTIAVSGYTGSTAFTFERSS